MTQSDSQLSFDNTAIAFASKDDGELRKASWLFRLMSNAAIVDIGSHLTRLALQVGLPVKSLVKQTIYGHFCGGESLEETIPTIDRLAEAGVSTILDYGVEAKEDEAEFDLAVEEQLRAIRFADENANVPYLSCKFTGYASTGLLRALHRNEPLSEEDAAALSRLRGRLRQICDCAVASDAAIYVDAEESWLQDGIDRIVDEMMFHYNKEKPVVFNTVQLYRHDRLAFLKRSHQKARNEGYILGVKLVRGAYMEKERERAQRKGYESPIHANKAAVDADFDEALVYCLEHIDEIAFCAATHNEASCMLLVEQASKAGVPLHHPHIHFAQLYGMSDHISFNLAQAGCNASKYVPYGPVRDVIPYLIRRARENRSVAGQVSRELRLILDEIQRRNQPKQITSE